MSPYIIQKLALFERSKNWVNQMTSVMFLLFFRYGTWIINTAPLRLRVGYHFGHDCDLPSITCCTFVINPRTVRILEPYAWPKIKIENKNYLSCEALHHIEKLVHFAILCDIFWKPKWEQTYIYLVHRSFSVVSLYKMWVFSPLTYCHAYFMFFTVLLWEVIYKK